MEGNIFGLPTCKVDEFSASGTGALALSGQEKAGHTAARAFCAALGGDELGIFLACQELTKLHREEYADFCDESCRLLTQTVRRTGDRRCLDIFEYLEKQRAMLVQNPSVTALSGALAAFCGAL